MIDRIIEYSARNRFVVFLFVAISIFWGGWTLLNIPLDAVPDLSDPQVIIFTEWMGRSPDLIEDQITYPIVTSLLAAPRVQLVRGQSMFGMSFVYVIFEEGTDMYWARSRVLEYMNSLSGRFPEGVSPRLGPDATGVGWVFQYALVDKSGQNDLAQLRTFQDWYLKYWLESVPGVAEVASIGGFVRQYQINVDPAALLAYNIPLSMVMHAVRQSNIDVGGSVIEIANTEHVIRGRGYIKTLEDVENIPVMVTDKGTPVLIKNIARVQYAPAIRRGLAELDGEGEVVGGIVVMRFGENALDVINRVKAKIDDITPSLPEGVHIVTTYDRSELIEASIATLREKLSEEMLIVALVIVIFLFHFRSALVPIITLPIAVLISFIPMYYMGITSNIMSLGGIAIAIGAMVDAAIVLVENTHKRLEQWEATGKQEDRSSMIIAAIKEVGKPIFFSLLVITVSFLPIFTLQAQEGRLFKPLAYTKTFSMLFAALLAITLAPSLILLLVRGRIRHEDKNPISRALIWLYQPVVKFALRWRVLVIVLAIIVMLLSVPVYLGLGSEFMPPLNEGSILYMPTSVPGMPVAEASRVLQLQNKLIREFPEVERVFGKVGRAETATDPAPLNMVETTILLKPQSEWRPGMTWDKLIQELDHNVRIPGMPNIWWMPVQTRTEMLTTGVRSNLAIKVFGADLEVIEKVAVDIENALQRFPDTRSVFAERITGGQYIDFAVNRAQAARFGLTVEEVSNIIEMAIGGMTITTTIEGKERYPVAIRYAQELRDDLTKLQRVLVPTNTGAQVPISQLADIRIVTGPPMILNEDGSRVAYVIVDVVSESYGDYVEAAKKYIAENVDIPAGYTIAWAGQYQYLERMREQLRLVVPLTLAIIFLLLYFNFKSVTETLIVLLSVPFSVVGAVLLLALLNYNMSIAVWVGIIALAGVAAETGVVMIVYLDEAYHRRARAGTMHSLADLTEAVMEGSVQRVRPKMMTVGTTILGLMPIMWSTGTGADVMQRIAAPMIGGLITSTILTLIIIPAIYMIWKRIEMQRLGLLETE